MNDEPNNEQFEDLYHQGDSDDDDINVITNSSMKKMDTAPEIYEQRFKLKRKEHSPRGSNNISTGFNKEDEATKFDDSRAADVLKPWDLPGADIRDYFNFGFNEQTWMQYCMMQKSLRVMNKSNIRELNDLSDDILSGMDQRTINNKIFPHKESSDNNKTYNAKYDNKCSDRHDDVKKEEKVYGRTQIRNERVDERKHNDSSKKYVDMHTRESSTRHNSKTNKKNVDKTRKGYRDRKYEGNGESQRPDNKRRRDKTHSRERSCKKRRLRSRSRSIHRHRNRR